LGVRYFLCGEVAGDLPLFSDRVFEKSINCDLVLFFHDFGGYPKKYGLPQRR
jgi:hypothetical protein